MNFLPLESKENLVPCVQGSLFISIPNKTLLIIVGTLVASTNRGCSALRAAGGVSSFVLNDGKELSVHSHQIIVQKIVR